MGFYRDSMFENWDLPSRRIQVYIFLGSGTGVFFYYKKWRVFCTFSDSGHGSMGHLVMTNIDPARWDIMGNCSEFMGIA